MFKKSNWNMGYCVEESHITWSRVEFLFCINIAGFSNNDDRTLWFEASIWWDFLADHKINVVKWWLVGGKAHASLSRGLGAYKLTQGKSRLEIGSNSVATMGNGTLAIVEAKTRAPTRQRFLHHRWLKASYILELPYLLFALSFKTNCANGRIQ